MSTSISGLCSGRPRTRTWPSEYCSVGVCFGTKHAAFSTHQTRARQQQEGVSTPHLSSTKFWTTGEALPLPSSACPGSQNEDAARRDHEDRHPLQRLRGLGPEIEKRPFLEDSCQEKSPCRPLEKSPLPREARDAGFLHAPRGCPCTVGSECSKRPSEPALESVPPVARPAVWGGRKHTPSWASWAGVGVPVS